MQRLTSRGTSKYQQGKVSMPYTTKVQPCFFEMVMCVSERAQIRVLEEPIGLKRTTLIHKPNENSN